MRAQQKLFLARELLDAAGLGVSSSTDTMRAASGTGAQDDQPPNNAILLRHILGAAERMRTCAAEAAAAAAAEPISIARMDDAWKRSHLPKLALNFGVSASDGTGMRISTLFAVLRGMFEWLARQRLAECAHKNTNLRSLN